MKKNNNGAALANVMLISAFVMIMATTIISIAFSNYRMKMINLNAKNNFYACEAILDEFRVDFRNKVVKSSKSSDADKFYDLFCEYALGEVKYTSGTPKGDKDPTIYDVKAIASLISIVNGQTVAANQWTPVTINGKQYTHAYETTVNGVHVVVSATSDYTNTEDEMVGVYSQKVINKSQGQYNLSVTDNSVVFNNVTVTYEQNGYSNSISTDIDLGFMGEKSKTFTLDTYSIISFGGWSLNNPNTGNSGTYVVEGNMYLENVDPKKYALETNYTPDGYVYTLICTGEQIIINGNLHVGNGAKICFPNAIDIYINGNIVIDEGSEFVLGQNASVYVTNLTNRTFYTNNNGLKGMKVLTGDLSKTNDRRDFSKQSDNLFDFKGEFISLQFDDIIAKNKKITIDGKEYEVGTDTSDQNFFSANTKMMEENPADQNYAVMTNQATLNQSNMMNKQPTDDKAAIAVFKNNITDLTVLERNYRGIIICKNDINMSLKIDKNNPEKYSVGGILVDCVILKPLGDRYKEILNIKMDGEHFDFLFGDIFVDKDIQIGVSTKKNNTSTNEKESGSRRLSITYSNWSRE